MVRKKNNISILPLLLIIFLCVSWLTAAGSQ